ncbi:hypothetical protein ASZ90_016038 [hydrocarbon metagenome]|uniref:Uncharacterized protein n=1 Tax=hydrocarbon metagenome TaxID=938273 RepID=A0A0W8F0Q1_9ZZZZ
MLSDSEASSIRELLTSGAIAVSLQSEKPGTINSHRFFRGFTSMIIKIRDTGRPGNMDRDQGF